MNFTLTWIIGFSMIYFRFWLCDGLFVLILAVSQGNTMLRCLLCSLTSSPSSPSSDLYMIPPVVLQASHFKSNNQRLLSAFRPPICLPRCSVCRQTTEQEGKECQQSRTITRGETSADSRHSGNYAAAHLIQRLSSHPQVFLIEHLFYC